MALYAADGTTRLDRAAALAKATTVVPADPQVKVTENLYFGTREDGTDFPENRRQIAFHKGQIVPKSAIERYFRDATITSIVPVEGAAAGGTTVTIRGSNFTPGATPKLGGTAFTNVTVKNETTITGKIPAKTAGAYDVSVTTDAGTVTKTGVFTTA
ncbi:IPT/TIG domain-containing protein (plasmid) [Microtetraspora malaysiensis]|uniref:IPT/TIG domain-containing protein n=1 Tax=Microtetraspora malaysiensis TaxID=161358 RepID=UPI003D9394F5